MKILIVDDDPDILEAVYLAFNLQWQECDVHIAQDGQSGLASFFEKQPEVMILDVVMPGMDGFEVLRRIRAVSDTPIIMLTAKCEEIDKVKGLELGADDYITKPFGHLELFARIKAVLRRVRFPPPISPVSSFVCGDLSVNFERREVSVRCEPIKLTSMEYNLLYYLVRNAGRVLTHEMLLSRVWGNDYRSDIDYLKVYISRLRNKLEDNPHRPKYILTEWGVGYRFNRATSLKQSSSSL